VVDYVKLMRLSDAELAEHEHATRELRSALLTLRRHFATLDRDAVTSILRELVADHEVQMLRRESEPHEASDGNDGR
jgi:hypothetical protein